MAIVAVDDGAAPKFRFEVGTAPAFFASGNDVFYIGNDVFKYASGFTLIVPVKESPIQIKTGKAVDFDKKFVIQNGQEDAGTDTPDDPCHVIWTCSIGDIRISDKDDWKKSVRTMSTETPVFYKPPDMIMQDSMTDMLTAQMDDQWWTDNPYKPDTKNGEHPNSKRDDAPSVKITLNIKIVKTAPTKITQVSAKVSPLKPKEFCERVDGGTGLKVKTLGFKYYELEVGPPPDVGSYKGYFVFETSEKLDEVGGLKSTLTEADLDGATLENFYKTTSQGFVVGEKYNAMYDVVPQQNDNRFWDAFFNSHLSKNNLKGAKGATKGLWYRHYYWCQGQKLDTGGANKGFLGLVVLSNIDHPCDNLGLGILLTDVFFDDRKAD